MQHTPLSEEDISRIIEMAWEDRTPFEAIELQFGLKESAVVELMRKHMKASSFKMWRKRMAGRNTKHVKLRSPDVDRHHCPTQYKPR
ncbi:MAG TPA: TIGR03643 family protein [Limnobacter sp.]|nr:TIGR03643 family protein [Limnobacter sp.]